MQVKCGVGVRDGSRAVEQSRGDAEKQRTDLDQIGSLARPEVLDRCEL